MSPMPPADVEVQPSETLLPQPMLNGPCGEPCSSPCSDPCSEAEDSPCEGEEMESIGWIPRVLNTGFRNALHIAFDELLREPKRILMIGGCRQRDVAKYLAFLLPSTDIYVLDPELAEVERAQAEICCRFKFTHGEVEALPFEAGFFDLVLGHHAVQYVKNWDLAMAEMARVSASHVLLTTPRPVSWMVAKRLPGTDEAFVRDGLALPKGAPGAAKLWAQLERYAEIQVRVSPWPWQMVMAAVAQPAQEAVLAESQEPVSA